MARLGRDENGRRKDDVDFDLSLSENLERLGVAIEKLPDAKDAALRRWSIPGRVLGEFDAHFGWCILRHYNLCGMWLIALRNATGEYYHGYGQTCEEMIGTCNPTHSRAG